MHYGHGTQYTYKVDENLATTPFASLEKYTSPSLYHTDITNLPASTVIYYQIGLREASTGIVTPRTDTFSFRTPSAPGDGTEKMTFTVIGDMGQTQYSLNTRDSVLNEVNDSSFAMIVGDLSYADGNATRWDTWGNDMEELFSQLPLMVLPGNHEIEIDDESRQPFLHYRNRFKMPQWKDEATLEVEPFETDKWKTYEFDVKYDGGSSYYSFNVGLCHIIAINAYNTHPEHLQEDFVTEDLAQVNKSITPFILVFIHAPLYNR